MELGISVVPLGSEVATEALRIVAPVSLCDQILTRTVAPEDVLTFEPQVAPPSAEKSSVDDGAA
ncbi:hypothetical protein GCM10009544_46300 [Streptomyces stramineus]|uniref:Uncharacterized protein n=1 Tax=Streptomyces stramineus TaxID=173861 RepID=A0ABP3KJS3_9ACTN